MPLPDIQTRGFQAKTSLDAASKLLLEGKSPLPHEQVESGAACGRVLAQPVACPYPIPAFKRSAMDGFAVRAKDMPSVPISLHLAGAAFPGQAIQDPLKPGTTIRVMTGAPVPPEADTVVPVEQCRVDGNTVTVLIPVAQGKHVALPGEDFTAGQIVFEKGHRLRPPDIAVLSALGISRVNLARHPIVSILVTGNEILPPFSTMEGTRIADANSPMLWKLAERDGGTVFPTPKLIPDQPESLATTLADLAGSDVVLISGGSSVGLEDHSPGVLARMGSLDIHGLAIRPASPAGFGRLPSGTHVFLLPGNPVSCLCAYELLAGKLIRLLAGLPVPLPHRTQAVPLASALVSALGRTDFARVRIKDGQAEPLATGGAGRLSTVALADGFVLIPPETEALSAGELVIVHMF